VALRRRLKSSELSLRDRPRPAVAVDRDVREVRFGHLHDVQGGRVALRVDLDVDRDRRRADPLDAGIEAQQIGDRDRLLEDELVDGDRRDPPLRDPGRKDGAGDVDLRHDPAAEDVAVAVGVGGHRHHAHDELVIALQLQRSDAGDQGGRVGA
jgi:hypothetical protein